MLCADFFSSDGLRQWGARGKKCCFLKRAPYNMFLVGRRFSVRDDSFVGFEWLSFENTGSQLATENGTECVGRKETQL